MPSGAAPLNRTQRFAVFRLRLRDDPVESALCPRASPVAPHDGTASPLRLDERLVTGRRGRRLARPRQSG